MTESKQAVSDAATHHESASLNKGKLVITTQPTSKQPTLPVNTGDGWRKGEGTDMI